MEIKRFLNNHDVVCNKNWVCKALQLRNVVVQTKTPDLSPKVVQAGKARLSYINNW